LVPLTSREPDCRFCATFGQSFSRTGTASGAASRPQAWLYRSDRIRPQSSAWSLRYSGICIDSRAGPGRRRAFTASCLRRCDPHERIRHSHGPSARTRPTSFGSYVSTAVMWVVGLAVGSSSASLSTNSPAKLVMESRATEILNGGTLLAPRRRGLACFVPARAPLRRSIEKRCAKSKAGILQHRIRLLEEMGRPLDVEGSQESSGTRPINRRYLAHVRRLAQLVGPSTPWLDRLESFPKMRPNQQQ